MFTERFLMHDKSPTAIARFCFDSPVPISDICQMLMDSANLSEFEYDYEDASEWYKSCNASLCVNITRLYDYETLVEWYPQFDKKCNTLLTFLFHYDESESNTYNSIASYYINLVGNFVQTSIYGLSNWYVKAGNSPRDDVYNFE